MEDSLFKIREEMPKQMSFCLVFQEKRKRENRIPS
jgi:hypothetical protein